METNIANSIIESLRKGLPPTRGVDKYSVGHEKLIQGINKHHFHGIANRGIIRFVSGSWGSGKTHFFRLLREVAFQNECLVSNVELNADNAALNKFEKVFYSIIRNISTPESFSKNTNDEIAPFGRVLQESLAYLATGNRSFSNNIISYDEYVKARELLMQDRSIDIDFKKMIQEYWKTFLPDAPDQALQEQNRAEILQWFSGEGSVATYRRRFEVNKIVNKDNAKLMLQSLAGFVKLSAYKGLVILFDEAEQAYSIMRKSSLKDAHNNLLSLINNIESLNGLFLIYATTPDFFTDPKHGIIIYGALQGRIGKPEHRKPRALDSIWNLDEVETNLVSYQDAAKRIRDIYVIAHPGNETKLPCRVKIDDFVEELFNIHPALSGVRFWRVLVTSLIAYLDDYLDGDGDGDGDVRTTEIVYSDVMERLRED
jgi:P-loop Domain of unknown function (DUF2791)